MKHLIVSEGSKTEPAYFNAFLKHFGITDVGIEPSPSPDPLKVIRFAIAQANRNDIPATAVIDVEDPSDRTRRHHLQKALKLAETSGIQLALSNPSFELFLWIHEDPHAARLPPCPSVKVLLKRIHSQWGSYSKSRLPLQRLFHTEAMENVFNSSIARPNLTARDIIDNNPSTSVPQMLQCLLSA